jgi:hypothetical protein
MQKLSSISRHLRYPSSRSRSSQLFNLDFAFSVFIGCSSPTMESILVVPPAVPHTFAFKSFRIMLQIICPWQTIRCCRCIRFWQTSSIKIIVFSAFVSFMAIASPCTISSTCRYRYPLHSTLHPVVLQITSLNRYRSIVPSSLPPSPSLYRFYPCAYQVPYSLRSCRFRQGLKHLYHRHLSLSSHPHASSISSCGWLSSSLLSSSTSRFHITNHSIQALQELAPREGVLS